MAELVSQPIPGQCFLEFELKLPRLTVPYRASLTAPATHEITETLFDSCTAVIGFNVANPAYLDTIIKALDSEGEPIVRWRIGLGTGQTVNWLPWQVYYVTQYSAHFQGVGNSNGHYIKLTCRDLLHRIDRSNKTAAHRGTISSIVRKLATNNGITDTVIENTTGEGLWVQSYEGDFEFVRSRFIARATSTRGRGNYYLFVRDNVLHFHTIEYQTVIKDFAYYLSPATKLEAIDLAQAKLDIGSAGVRVLYHDPYSGTSKELLSDPEKAVRLANSIPRLDKIYNAQWNIREHATNTRDPNAGSIALCQNAYESARSESFMLKMQTSKTPFIRPGELLRIAINPNNGTASTWSGLYLVTTASHLIENNELNSVYMLQRGEQQVARTGNVDLSAYGVDHIVDQQNAPGFDLNVREAQSSSLTKGAGKSTTNGAFLTVQDKSKALSPPSSNR